MNPKPFFTDYKAVMAALAFGIAAEFSAAFTLIYIWLNGIGSTTSLPLYISIFGYEKLAIVAVNIYHEAGWEIALFLLTGLFSLLVFLYNLVADKTVGGHPNTQGISSLKSPSAFSASPHLDICFEEQRGNV